MWLRANVVLAVAVVLAVVQMFASVTGGPRIGDFGALTGTPDRGLSRSVAAQEEEDDDDDDEDDDDDDDDDEEDNEGDEDDNADDDNADDDGDNACDDLTDNAEDEDDDNVDCDDEDDDNDDDNDDSDDDDADDDNDDDDADNDEEESDNDEDDADDDDDDDAEEVVEEGADNGEADEPAEDANDDDDDDDDAVPTAPVAQSGPPCAPNGIVSTAPGTEVQRVTNGRDVLLAIAGDRVSVQVAAATPAGICLALRLVDPLEYPAAPGVRAGDYIFQVEAFDEFGAPLAVLPADVTVAVQYANADVAGLNEQGLTLSRLDPLDQTWKFVPNVLLDPTTNWVWAATLDTGVFVAHVP